MKKLYDKYKTVLFSLILCVGVLVLFKIFTYNDIAAENSALKLEILKKDSLIQHGEGEYSKLVNYYSTKTILNNQVKESSPNLFNVIKDNKETILSNTSANLTFKPKSGTVVIKDENIQKDSIFSFSSFYPSKEKAFIKYDASVNPSQKTVDEKWTFNELKINVILTEKENGLWNTYLDAPEYVTVNNITVNSLPPTAYSSQTIKNPLIKFYIGAGARSNTQNIKDYTKLTPTANAIMSIADKVLLEGNIGTDKQIGAALLIKL